MVPLTRLAFLALAISCTNAFQSPVGYNKIQTPITLYAESSDSDDTTTKPALSSLVNRVAVAGATGRTGKFVVQQLLEQNVPVLAMVRDVDKANDMFDPTNSLLTIRQTDLGNEEDITGKFQLSCAYDMCMSYAPSGQN